MLKYLYKIKTWIILLSVGLALQMTGFLLLGLGSINHFTPLVFYTLLWLIVYKIIRTIHKNSHQKFENYHLLNTSIFVCFIIVEMALRISGNLSMHTEKKIAGLYQSPYNLPNKRFWIDKRESDITLSSSEFSYERKINSEGFSDREWELEKITNKFRILTLGDSFTEGDGADADSTWQRFMERRLNDSGIYIMNAGICGSDPVFEYYLLKERLIKYRPDLVVVCINKSDLFDIMIRGGMERFDCPDVVFRKGPWWEFIYATSYISRLFFRLKYDTQLINKNALYLQQSYSLLVIAQTMREFAMYCKVKGSSLLFVFHPGPGELAKTMNPFKELIAVSKKYNYKVADLYDYYNQTGIPRNLNKYYWPKDSHHRANGYNVMSDGILKTLRKEGMLNNSIK